MCVRVITPARSGWGRGYPKVPTPLAKSGWRRGYPKVPPPPSQVKMGKTVPQGTYPPPQSGQDGGGGTPRYLPPPPGQGLATQRAVCVLCSRRRTFLFYFSLVDWVLFSCRLYWALQDVSFTRWLMKLTKQEPILWLLLLFPMKKLRKNWQGNAFQSLLQKHRKIILSGKRNCKTFLVKSIDLYFRGLVQSKLAACVNIIPGITSV